MKKKKINENFDGIQFEEGDDVDFFAKCISLILMHNPEGDYYCWDYATQRVIMYSEKRKCWERYPFDDYMDYPEVPREEALEFYKEHPPFALLEEMENEHEQEILKEWDDLRNKTPHKVVGWIYRINGLYKRANDEDGLYSAALINDIDEHQYAFAGQSIDLVPIFEDGTFIDFSSRGWGHILALAYREAKDFSYSGYAFYGFDHTNYPDEGTYDKRVANVTISDEDFQGIKKYISTFLEDPKNEDYYYSYFIIDEYELDEDFSGAEIYSFVFKNKDTGEIIDNEYAKFMTFDNVEDYHYFVDDKTENENWKMFLKANHQRIEEKFEKGKVTIIVLVAFCE